MSDTSTKDFYTRQAAEARGPEPHAPAAPQAERRRLKRIAIASGVSLASWLARGRRQLRRTPTTWPAGVHRIPVAALDAQEPASVRAAGRGA